MTKRGSVLRYNIKIVLKQSDFSLEVSQNNVSVLHFYV